jgi:hypothetical protein
MNKSLTVALIVIAVIVAAGALILAGMAINRNALAFAGSWPAMMTNGFLGGTFGQAGRFGRMGPNMMQGYEAGGITPARAPGAGVGWSRGGYGNGGMTPAPAPGAGVGWSRGGYGTGGMMGAGMMGYGVLGTSGLSNVNPLTLEEAEAAVQDYLASLGDDNLALGEIMIFDNHAYAQILEADTGFGAQEVLVDPATLSVYPEHGPNMMWNQKYGVMAGHMGWTGASFAGAAGSPEDMPVTAEEAVEKAQAYLSNALPGTSVEEADPFYGYYTLDILQDGAPIGMLSVNGTTGQVFVHTWHGDFVEMAEAE